jgi:hypothetical protein
VRRSIAVRKVAAEQPPVAEPVAPEQVAPIPIERGSIPVEPARPAVRRIVVSREE